MEIFWIGLSVGSGLCIMGAIITYMLLGPLTELVEGDLREDDQEMI